MGERVKVIGRHDESRNLSPFPSVLFPNRIFFPLLPVWQMSGGIMAESTTTKPEPGIDATKDR
jgi:hypothetical protein